LVDVGDQPVPPTLKPLNALDTRPAYADTKASPYAYNPYPDYNSDAWKKENQGTYVPCHGPEHFEPSSVVFRGKSEAFTEPGMGSYKALGIDSTICFEREGWLGPYATKKSIWGDEGLINWDNVNWKTLHDYCYFNNSDRYAGRSFKRDLSVESTGDAERAHSRDFPTVLPRNEELPERSEDAEEEADTSGPNPERDAQPATRTAILLRAYSGIKFTENDKQSIRVLINELSLRSGAEYEVFFLMQIKNAPLTLDAAQKDLPREFWDMAVVWNDEQMAEYYPKLPADANKVHVAQWLSVQKFANDRPDFDFYWNWELDTRLIGNHYEILQKLDEFSKKQPRKYLWERNERYYIPGVHGDYDTTFRKTVELAHGDDTVWGPVPLKGVDPSGPSPPVPSHREDNYEWGVGEDADYISLGPMFDPVDSSWVDLNSIWNFQTFLHTPRRATIGTQSRCSKRLLRAMHEETLKGNHIGSEMTPQSIALLHGFKAVYAPLPIFFDRAWSPESLNKFFNPGPLGESGSTLRTPYGWGLEQRFEGSTWYYRTTLPMKLYNSFLGWEDSGIGGERVRFPSSAA
jgi:hypothetical protein